MVIIFKSRFESLNGLLLNIETECTDDSCSYHFPNVDLISVDVEVIGCITEQINSMNLSSCKLHVA